MGMYEDRINRIALQPEKNKAKELTTIINEMPTKKLKFPSLTTIISGGQTGADTIGLEVAKELGIKTGGTAAKGYKTENGSNPQLAEYGLVEDTSDNYAERTRKNVKNSDGTVYFYQRSNTPGYIVTKNTAEQNKKPFLENPTAKELSD
jgi:predicted Rossmann-fold nucleotide-binding protein